MMLLAIISWYLTMNKQCTICTALLPRQKVSLHAVMFMYNINATGCCMTIHFIKVEAEWNYR